MTTVRIRRNEEKRILSGHPWVFANEIDEVQGDRTPGSAAALYDHRGRFLGVGTFNPHSLIAFRLMSVREGDDIDSPSFYQERIAAAAAFREALALDGTAVRLVYGESDRLPGLVVDRYGEYLSVQFLTAGIERRREAVLEALGGLFSPRGIVLRNDAAVRTLEGLERRVEILGTVPPLVEIMENGLSLVVDIPGGQKTGGFLDQRENHLLLKRIAAGREVLDCFSYSGSWGIHAASFGAERVTCLDVSARALSLVHENARRNGFTGFVETEECDVFDRLRSLASEGRRFGLIVLDPPAFVKSRKSLKEGVKGYLTINRRAMELLEPGGYLVTCSCSHHVAREDFRGIIVEAARRAGRSARLVRFGGQSPDHPVLLSFPESDYLKCAVVQMAEW